MENIAVNVNQMLNENAFLMVKGTVQEHAMAALQETGLPEQAVASLSGRLGAVVDSFQHTVIAEDIQKVNDAEGFAQTVFPFFIFLTYFLGATLMTGMHTITLPQIENGQSRAGVYATGLGINIILSLIIPCIVIGIAAAFDISFSRDIGTVWCLLALGFFTMVSMMQMFSRWLGLTGLGGAVLLFFPLQLVGSGLIYAEEILPVAYPAINDYLPASHFGNGILRIFYGELSLSGEMVTLLLMAGIFVVVSALSLLKKKNMKTMGI